MNAPDEHTIWLKTPELAKHVRLGRSTLQRRRETGFFREGLHFFRVGAHLRWDLRAVEEALRKKPAQDLETYESEKR